MNKNHPTPDRTLNVEVPCPFCPLTRNNVQTCDVLIDFRNLQATKVKVVEGTPREVVDAFNTLGLLGRNNIKIERDHSFEIDNDEFYLCINHTKIKNIYKICFHARKQCDCGTN